MKKDAPLRLYATSLVLAGLFLLPDMAEIFDFSLPARGILAVPYTGLGYLCTFFHEIGHAVTSWLFAYPSLPTFDFTYGGGFAYTMGREPLLLWLVYGAFVALSAWLARHQSYGEMAFILALAGAHLALAFNDGHEVLILFMGHGAEILVGSYCLYRAILNKTAASHGPVERYLNMTFGFFSYGKNILLFAHLMLSDIGRSAYAGQKGGHGMGDFSRAADILGTGLPAVSLLMLAFIALSAAGTLLAAARARTFMDDSFS